ncbi:hypothetical protein yc1106_01380 [Curvularia clavata]|uniref:Heterokaryon incompatibility domain-containing protein n=1 Tax=Curvularia clavata TaxID=95742 RepID=A0A9Q9DQ87_CURCL|nr:hypothetical protein yc1106_01380 [Curvularia clavata]
MADIFQGSALTIAATDSPSSHGGCFLTLEPPIELSNLTANLSQVPARFLTRHRDSGKELQVRLQATSVLLRVNKSALNARGWVLQEMVLSCRLLHCTRQELYWKCRCRCETELGMPYEATSNSHKLPRLRRDSLHKASETWYQWIRNYTPRVFSIYDDRLPAVAGITRFYQDVTGDYPMLGLWKRSLCQDLEWRVVPGTNIASASSSATFHELPSWSWFSCPYHIEFGFGAEYNMATGNTALHLQLVDFDLQWTSEQLTSAVAYTRLIVKGPVMEANFSRADSNCDDLRDAEVLKVTLVTQHSRRECPENPIVYAYFDQASHKDTFRATCLLLRSTETSNSPRFGFDIN